MPLWIIQETIIWMTQSVHRLTLLMVDILVCLQWNGFTRSG